MSDKDKSESKAPIKGRYVIDRPIYSELKAPPHKPGSVIEFDHTQVAHLVASGHLHREGGKTADTGSDIIAPPPPGTKEAAMPLSPAPQSAT